MNGQRAGIVVALGMAGVLAGDTMTLGAGQQPADAGKSAAWSEVKWPFPLDQWGVGRAFVCKPADCGSEVNIYLRPKIGFCNCATDVMDDADLDRVGDTELIARAVVASSPGQFVEIAWMKGRSRKFEKADRSRAQLLSIAFHDRCDLMVAVATFAPANEQNIEPAVIAFLNSERVLRWVKWLTL